MCDFVASFSCVHASCFVGKKNLPEPALNFIVGKLVHVAFPSDHKKRCSHTHPCRPTSRPIRPDPHIHARAEPEYHSVIIPVPRVHGAKYVCFFFVAVLFCFCFLKKVRWASRAAGSDLPEGLCQLIQRGNCSGLFFLGLQGWKWGP